MNTREIIKTILTTLALYGCMNTSLLCMQNAEEMSKLDCVLQGYLNGKYSQKSELRRDGHLHLVNAKFLIKKGETSIKEYITYVVYNSPSDTTGTIMSMKSSELIEKIKKSLEVNEEAKRLNEELKVIY